MQIIIGEKKKKKPKRTRLYKVDSFAKMLTYINMLLLIGTLICSLVICVLNGLDPSSIFVEIADCWKQTFPIYLVTKTVENVSKGVTGDFTAESRKKQETEPVLQRDEGEDNR